MTDFFPRLPAYRFYRSRRILRLPAVLGVALLCSAEGKPAARKRPAAEPAPDVLVLSNGDTLHGQMIHEINGKVTFHNNLLGNVTLPWNKIKELRVTERFVVLTREINFHGKRSTSRMQIGTFVMTHQSIAVHPASGPAGPLIPVKSVHYIMKEATLVKQAYRTPNFFEGWNGTVTAGGTVVNGTQNQFTVTGAVSLARAVPTVAWLRPRNRTTTNFSSSFGKITQPAYVSAGTLVPETSTKTSIYHADAERDTYFSSRFFALAQTSFDHNFGQDLALQQIFGGGIGWTAIKTSLQEIDLKGTIQYESQQFISGAASANLNLTGSTFSANYTLHPKLLTFTQSVAYLPAYNQPSAYSATETNSVTFPAYKNLGFTVGTMDSYLNNPPAATPPTKPNSFQFTMGLTYGFKSKY